ncbi:uncharacterized protein G2W53_025988 [Senna tora]|uniref:Uncharacterized protein n=1 Tax=Senna tora TaxID=362788 RepID=A0A834WH11_9FABA|nr:uncharacterized protein G2W53_025988 [Senna tora]
MEDQNDDAVARSKRRSMIKRQKAHSGWRS